MMLLHLFVNMDASKRKTKNCCSINRKSDGRVSRLFCVFPFFFCMITLTMRLLFSLLQCLRQRKRMSSSKGTRKRLIKLQRLEVISKLKRVDPPSIRSLARVYDVSEGAIRKIWNERENMQQRTALISDAAQKTSFWSTVGRFRPIKDTLYEWLDSMRRQNLTVPPSLTISKSREIANFIGFKDFIA
jgi:hypothetical protein